MLVLSRKVGESFLIGESVEVTVTRLQGNQVRIGIEAPREVSIRRAEQPGCSAGGADGSAGGSSNAGGSEE